MQTFPLKYSQMKKSGGVKSGDRGGHGKSPKREIERPGKAALSIAMVSLAVCGVALSR